MFHAILCSENGITRLWLYVNVIREELVALERMCVVRAGALITSNTIIEKRLHTSREGKLKWNEGLGLLQITTLISKNATRGAIIKKALETSVKAMVTKCRPSR
ncbi:hypothetical protein V1477_003371 [Vespula maculifrons]|uniref:Uncharacterized protein n=1 Tax=Vespula maculifrons TaxID=7453 RepID=A0ABD2CX33_VESMC